MPKKIDAKFMKRLERLEAKLGVGPKSAEAQAAAASRARIDREMNVHPVSSIGVVKTATTLVLGAPIAAAQKPSAKSLGYEPRTSEQTERLRAAMGLPSSQPRTVNTPEKLTLR